MRWVVLLVAALGCGEFDIKAERPIDPDLRASKPEPEPDLETAVERVLDGEDVLVSRDGNWLVARRCMWARRDLRACDVVFLERGRVTGRVPVFDSTRPGSLAKQAKQARRAVCSEVERTFGAQRVALSSKIRYGLRAQLAPFLVTRVVDEQLELFDFHFPNSPPRSRTLWPFGERLQIAELQSPRAPDLWVFELRLQPDAATTFAMFRGTGRGRYELLMIAPPMLPEKGQLRFPTREEVLALHETVGRELAQLPPGWHADGLRKRYGWLRITDWLDSPTERLDIIESLARLRAQIRR